MDDLISRQAAIDALEAKKDKSAKGDIGCFYNTIIQNNIDALKGLPSVQPEPNKGHWIEYGTYGDQYNANYIYKCSFCGRTISDPTTDFCPYCGANMTEECD